MSNYTPNLRLTQPVNGEAGWGDKVNNGVTLLVESALSGIANIVLADADYTLSTNSGFTDEARAMFLKVTGTATIPRNLICPAVPKLYFVKNSVGSSLVLKTVAGLGVSIPSGKSMVLHCDGTNVVLAMDYVPALSYNHDQAVASNTWVINHNLNKYPSVTITDSANDEVEGEVRYNGLNSLTVRFSAPFSGKAYLN
jgi:hypothetical protein